MHVSGVMPRGIGDTHPRSFCYLAAWRYSVGDMEYWSRKMRLKVLRLVMPHCSAMRPTGLSVVASRWAA